MCDARETFDCIVVGAGIGGLSAAYRLSTRGYRVLCLEKTAVLGGLARTFHVEENPLEAYYHHIFPTDTSVIALLKEIGLAQDIEYKKSSMGVFTDGRLFSFQSPKDLLFFTPLALSERINFCWQVLKIRNESPSKDLDDIPAVHWLHSRFKPRTSALLWEPLLRSKFGKDYSMISSVWLWERIKKRAEARGEKGSQEVLGYLKGSLQRLFDTLAARIRGNGGMVLLGRQVKRLLFEADRCVGVVTDTEKYHAPVIIMTVPLPIVQGFFAQSSMPNAVSERIRPYFDSLGAIRYQGIISLILKLKRAMTDFYWMNIADSEIPFSVLVEHTNLVSSDEYQGKHILYMGQYVSPDDPLLQSHPQEIYKKYIPLIKKVIPSLSEDDVEASFTFSDPYATPVYEIGFWKKMPSCETPLPGMFLLNNTQLYPKSRTVDQTVALADRLTCKISDKNDSKKTVKVG